MDMLDRSLIGVLTPSSNTVLEPATSAMLAGLPDVTAHFGRFRVLKITLDDDGLRQFATEEPLRAAELLADARVGVIGWSGTSASWLGFDTDQRLCDAIAQRTGVPGCTAVLAINELFERLGVTRFALVSPYTDDVQQRIVANYGAAGFDCVAEAHAGISDNFAFSEVDEPAVEAMIRQVAARRPQAIAIMCTNMRGAGLADRLERELGIPVIDSVAAFVWKALSITGRDPARVRGWGSLFQL
jgi:maleate isomerase